MFLPPVITDWPLFLAGLLATVALALYVAWRFEDSRWQRVRVAGVLAVIWLVGIIFINITGNFDPWEFNLFLDSAAFIAIILYPAGGAQIVIGLLYLGQIVFHSIYGARELLEYPNDGWFYYQWLTVLAWLQLLTLGGWSIGRLWQDRLRGLRLRLPALGSRAHLRHDDGAS